MLLGLVAAVVALVPQFAAAGDYPEKPIRFIVPYAAGGTTDLLSRAIAQKLSEALGQGVVPDNRPGAGGNVGAEIAAKSPPDGYTIVIATVGTISINPHLYSKMPFDPAKDLAPTSLAGDIFNVLVVHPSLPAQSVKALVALARSHPGQLNFGSSGTGAADHLAGELFQIMTGTKMVHVAYKGGPPAMVDLVGGNLQLMFSTMPTAIGLIKGRKLNPLAITNSRRFPVLPDVPTVAEAGVPGYVVNNWCGVFVPAAASADVIARLSVEIGRAIATSDVKRRLLDAGIDAIANKPAEFAVYIRDETAKWGKVIRDAKVTMD
jgi:tripartite-type tricarboxylate transporter receptor subunit TctC